MQVNKIHHMKKLKGKNRKIISIDAEKDFNKIQHPFMIKSSPRNGHRKNLCVSVAQSCLIFCNPMDCSLPATDYSSVHGILQARILEWVAIPCSRGSSWLRDQTQISCIGRQILYHLNHQGSPRRNLTYKIGQTHKKHYSQWGKSDFFFKIGNKTPYYYSI